MNIYVCMHAWIHLLFYEIFECLGSKDKTMTQPDTITVFVKPMVQFLHIKYEEIWLGVCALSIEVYPLKQ
jgi:hypothetical protein